MQFLYRRHPEIRVSLKLPIKPRGSAFLGPHTQEIGSGIAQVIIFSVSIFTYARFEWPGPTHGRIIFHRAVKKQDRSMR
jgi:hypothetical protein